ncbi:aminotransferase class III-fold pyridoxal phosphate-dependent enzyme [Methylotenera sp.]|uniref:aminotransferase class III-fold pyridoxal phosphate-dependent enzyme n=1 Tax=Methylotenera sp. TaxID=2051956 RepID=UPI0027312753|nr:aminotransferase class III-fold pyridoxal phosphate-dependent enzyme [Methylotenera sp.]MDP2071334.1 aminotransferase class III-fold pyridoxal phosphate-dependent enzyme [Methylotenera sp.]MDP3006376.1 aminotransferase class III-fold pyridoxal phosphate-dependent enzyme [Methylotenera sp.]
MSQNKPVQLPNMSNYWMPFTANRQFKAMPRLFKAAKGNYYTSIDDRQILDGTAGLWCVPAGHARAEIATAVGQQLLTLDYAPAFQSSHPLAFETAERLAEYMPAGLDRIFFTNSGSESADTALKIALAYHRVTGNPLRNKLIGRERGYHGVNFGGIAVGGIAGNRKAFGNGLAGVDHIRHPLDIANNAFTKGIPEDGGVALANEFEQRIMTLHDPFTIAALIVEPMQGSAGVIVPPAGYLKRLREICNKHGILLIFDEVITGFGRLGTKFGADYFDVIPDILTCAKGLTNGVVPMGAVAVKREIYDAFMEKSAAGAIELPHGYTYSAIPIACAAAIATLDIFATEKLEDRANGLSHYFESAAHSLKGLPMIKDIRNIGLVAGIEFEATTNRTGAFAFAVYLKCYELGLHVRYTGDIIAVSPPLTIEKHEIDRIFNTLSDAIKYVASQGEAGLNTNNYLKNEQAWAAHQQPT